MENIYEWLYDTYAESLLQELPPFGDRPVEKLAAAVPEQDRLFWSDALNTLRMDCGTAAFEAGVRLGLRLGG